MVAADIERLRAQPPLADPAAAIVAGIAPFADFGAA